MAGSKETFSRSLQDLGREQAPNGLLTLLDSIPVAPVGGSLIFEHLTQDGSGLLSLNCLNNGKVFVHQDSSSGPRMSIINMSDIVAHGIFKKLYIGSISEGNFGIVRKKLVPLLIQNKYNFQNVALEFSHYYDDEFDMGPYPGTTLTIDRERGVTLAIDDSEIIERDDINEENSNLDDWEKRARALKDWLSSI